MHGRHRWALAALCLGGGILLTGCPDEVASTEPPRTPPLKARDYLFPTSAQASYRYEETTTLEAPGEAPNVSTISFQIRTVRLTENEVDYVQELTDAPPLGTMPLATFSLKADPTGVSINGQTLLGPLEPLVFVDAALTTKGDTDKPASGSAFATTIARVALEKLTVPAGTFDAVHVKQKTGNKPPFYYWLAKGMGYWGLKETRMSTRSNDSDTISTTSTEVLLKSFTP